jgi:hypothetical protein
MLCSLFGAFGSMGVVINQDFLMLFGDWFSEQFSTGVLILPCILTAVWPDTRLALNSKRCCQYWR